MNSSTVRRSQAQWQAIIDEFQQSGLSGTKFCSKNTIPYASFSKWRQRLTKRPAKSSEKPTTDFIDLGLLHGHPNISGNWQITLKLGNGVELCLSQADVSTRA